MRGQLGTELATRIRTRFEAEVIGPPHQELDLAQEDQISAFMAGNQFDLLVNCTAYNQVEAAQNDPGPAFALNASAVANLAALCKKRGVYLVHFSTDYVFDGTKGSPYDEDDTPNPLNIYGLSKYAGEASLRILHSRHCIIRTSGLYGKHRSPSAKMNFVETILSRVREDQPLSVRNDLICTPTSASELADAACELMDQEAVGTFHASNSGSCSWFDFASEILRLEKISAPIRSTIGDTPTTAASRPAYSVLNTQKLERLGIRLSSWQEALARYLFERKS